MLNSLVKHLVKHFWLNMIANILGLTVVLHQCTSLTRVLPRFPPSTVSSAGRQEAPPPGHTTGAPPPGPMKARGGTPLPIFPPPSFHPDGTAPRPPRSRSPSIGVKNILSQGEFRDLILMYTVTVYILYELCWVSSFLAESVYFLERSVSYFCGPPRKKEKMNK